MTVIVSVYVPNEGFVVGADGLRRDERTNIAVTEEAKKIFRFETGNLRLLYAWAGSTHLFFPDGAAFSFLDESPSVWECTSKTKPNSFSECVAEFAEHIYKRLSAASAHGSFPARETIAQLLVVGYLNGKPYRAQVKFAHRISFLLRPDVYEIREAPVDFNLFSGSTRIYYSYFAATLEQPDSLEHAADLVRSYIQTCIDNRDAEPECAGFGGRIHFETVVRPDVSN